MQAIKDSTLNLHGRVYDGFLGSSHLTSSQMFTMVFYDHIFGFGIQGPIGLLISSMFLYGSSQELLSSSVRLWSSMILGSFRSIIHFTSFNLSSSF